MNDYILRNSLMRAIDRQVKNCFKFKPLRNSSTGGLSVREKANYAYSKFEVVDEIFFKGCHYEWHIGKEERLTLAYHIENKNITDLLGERELQKWGERICRGLLLEIEGLNLFNKSPSELGSQHFNCRQQNCDSHYWWIGVDVGNINVIRESMFRRSEIILLSDLITRVIEKSKTKLDYSLLRDFVC